MLLLFIVELNLIKTRFEGLDASHSYCKCVTTQNLDFLSYGSHSTRFTLLYQSLKVKDSTVKIRQLGSSCVCKIVIEPTVIVK